MRQSREIKSGKIVENGSVGSLIPKSDMTLVKGSIVFGSDSKNSMQKPHAELRDIISKIVVSI
jgi:hypothetical protein